MQSFNDETLFKGVEYETLKKDYLFI